MNSPPRRRPPVRSADGRSERFLSGVERTPLLILIGFAIAVIVVIWILLLPPFSVLRGGGCRQPAGTGYSVCAVNAIPVTPAGLAPASRYYRVFLQKSAGSAVTVSFPLADPRAANQDLGFYTYQGGKWQEVAPASVGPDGVSAQGQIQNLPGNIILLKRQSGGVQVMGTLPSGKTLSAEAAKLITVLNPAGFSPAADGSVTGESQQAAAGSQYQVIPAVQATSGTAASAVNQILQSTGTQSTHIAALVALANRPGNAGVELDYTQVDAKQSQAFGSFVQTLAQQLHKDNRQLVLELPAPVLTANGWDTGAYNWGTLAKSADYLKLVPNPDQSVYRKQVPELLKYLTAQAGVSAQKLILVTSALSADKSDQGVRMLPRLSALSIASQIRVQNGAQAVAGSPVNLVAANLDQTGGGSGMAWDPSAASVSFAYKVGDATHVVWIANQFSEAFKLQYVQQFHLGGVAVDDASGDAAIGDLWPAIAAFSAKGAPVLQQPNPELLMPVWMVDGKPLDAGGKTSATWQAPAQPGTHTISLIVSDGVIRVLGTVAVALQAGPPSNATATSGGIVAGTVTPRAAPPTAVSVQPQFPSSTTPPASP